MKSEHTFSVGETSGSGSYFFSLYSMLNPSPSFRLPVHLPTKHGSRSHTQQSRIGLFKVAWLASDTSASFNYLAQNAADVSITYHAAAEHVAMQQGIADRCEYAWRDHWMLVGQSPQSLFHPPNQALTVCTRTKEQSSKSPSGR